VILAKSRAALLEGDLDTSEALALQASTLGLGGDDESAFHALGTQLLMVRREQARLDELLPGAEAFAAQYPEVPAWRCGLAYVYAELGRKEDASRELDTLGADGFGSLTRDAWWLLGMSMLSEAAAFVEHPVHAPVLYELIAPYAEHCVVITTVCCGSAARPAGLLATACGRFDDAERHFDQALRINARIRSPLWVGHTQRDYALMLLRRDRPGDRARAGALLDEALSTARELGLHAVARKAELLVPGA
jgi:tetratricopeptide (TPR) repeat protein